MPSSHRTPPRTQKYLRACSKLVDAMLDEGPLTPSSFVTAGTAGPVIDKGEILRLLKGKP